MNGLGDASVNTAPRLRSQRGRIVTTDDWGAPHHTARASLTRAAREAFFLAVQRAHQAAWR